LTTVPLYQNSQQKLLLQHGDNWHGIGNRERAGSDSSPLPEPDELVQAARESAVEDAQAGRIRFLLRNCSNSRCRIEPALTEEEEIALAVETIEDATPEASEPIRPHPPDPKL